MYVVRLNHMAYRTATLATVVELGATRTVGSIHLEPAVIEMREVVVKEHPLAFDPTTSALGTRLSAEEVQGLPSDRSFR